MCFILNGCIRIGFDLALTTSYRNHSIGANLFLHLTLFIAIQIIDSATGSFHLNANRTLTKR